MYVYIALNTLHDIKPLGKQEVSCTYSARERASIGDRSVVQGAEGGEGSIYLAARRYHTDAKCQLYISISIPFERHKREHPLASY